MTNIQLNSLTFVLVCIASLRIAVALLARTLALLQSDPVQRFWRGTKRQWSIAQRLFAAAMYDPVEHPRMERIAEYLKMYISYFFALSFVLVYFYFAILFVYLAPDLSLLGQLGMLASMVLWAVCVMLYKADGNRRRVVLTNC